MATVGEKMTALADAVRGKTGDTNKLTLDQMTTAITNYTTDGSASAADILQDKTAYVNNNKITGAMVNNGKVVKTLTQGDSTWVMGEGYYAKGSGVSVNTTTATVTPTKSQQILSSTSSSDPFYSMVTVKAIPSQYITTTDATVTADQIFIDKTAYVNGNKITGTFTIDDEITTQENLINQINAALEGKGAGSGGTSVAAPDTCTFTLGHIASDANLKFYYTAWENNALVSKVLTSSGTANNVLCNSLIIADTSTGAITKSVAISNSTMLYASNDSTMVVFQVTASAGGSGQIYVMTGQSGM